MDDELSLSGKLKAIDKLLDEFQETLDKETWKSAMKPGEMEYNVGKRFYDEQKMELAMRAFSVAVEKGHVRAMVRLGKIYSEGNNMMKAFPLFLKAAELGDITAMNNTATCYTLGLGTNKNLGEAEEWKRKYIEAKKAKAAGKL